MFDLSKYTEKLDHFETRFAHVSSQVASLLTIANGIAEMLSAVHAKLHESKDSGTVAQIGAVVDSVSTVAGAVITSAAEIERTFSSDFNVNHLVKPIVTHTPDLNTPKPETTIADELLSDREWSAQSAGDREQAP